MMLGLGTEYDPETGMTIYDYIEPLEWDPSLDTEYQAAFEQLEWDPMLDTVPPGTTLAQIQKQSSAVAAMIAAAAAGKAATAKGATAKTPARTQIERVIACKSGADASGKCKDYVPGLSNSWLVGGAGIFAMLMIVLAMGGRR